MINDSNANVQIADVLAVLKAMTKTRQDIYEIFMKIHKNIRINERLRCIFRNGVIMIVRTVISLSIYLKMNTSKNVMQQYTIKIRF